MLLLLVAESVSDSLASPWTVACQTPLFMAFSRQEYWNGLLCPPPGDFPDSGIGPESPVSHALQMDSSPTEPPGKPLLEV